MKNFSQESQYLSQDLKWAHPMFKPEVLSVERTCLVVREMQYSK
jgi:hypothetical protein